MCLVLASCGNKHEASRERLAFTTDVRLRTTPVKDQGSTSLCWVYAMLATIETEHIMQGDSVNLSADYVARAFLREQALEQRAAEDWTLTTRGMATMTLRLIATYGLTHHDAFHRREDTNFKVLDEKLRLARGMATSLDDYIRRVDGQLAQAFGEPMPTVFFLGVQYTPLEFAHSVCHDGEYEALTSFTHHAFGERFPLEVADNHYHDTYLNVPLDTLYRKVVRALLHGHPVCWEGDTSEPGFSFARGVAMLPSQTASPAAVRTSQTAPCATQTERQQAFESGATTDDHCMEMVGLAHDQHGRRYFIMKNSWGTDNRYGGFMYMSEDYFRLKTIAVVLPAES